MQVAIEQRREPRNEISSNRPVDVLVRCTAHVAGQTYAGSMRNVSPGGVQILLPKYVRESEEIELRIEVPYAELSIFAIARVCWVRPVADDQCLIGCAFSVDLSCVVIDRMGALGIIDRRKHERRAVNVNGKAHSDEESEEFAIQVTDYSQGGFCMAADRPLQMGDSVSVELMFHDGVSNPIAGEVCWHAKRAGKYFAGCAVRQDEDVAVLRRCFESHERLAHVQVPSPVLKLQGRKKISLGKFGYCGIVLAAVVLGLFLRWPQVVSLMTGTQAVAQAHSEAWPAPTVQQEAAKDRASTHVNVSHHDRREVIPSPTKPTKPTKPTTTRRPKHDARSQRDTATTDVKTVKPVTRRKPEHNTVPATTQLAAPSPVEKPVEKPVDLAPSITEPPRTPARTRTRVAAIEKPAHRKDPTLVLPSTDPQQNGKVTKTKTEQPKQIAKPVVKNSTLESRKPRDKSKPTNSSGTKQTTEPLAPRARRDSRPPAVSRSDNPAHAKREFTKGENFYRQQQFDQAKAAFESAIRLDHDNAFYYYLLAMTYHELGDIEQAERVARQGVQLERKQPVSQWGTRVSRYQGRVRIWIERQRRARNQR